MCQGYGRPSSPVLTSSHIHTGAIEMAEEQIEHSALWIALMLTYLMGDVLRIFSGDFIAGIGGMEVTQTMYLGMTILWCFRS